MIIRIVHLVGTWYLANVYLPNMKQNFGSHTFEDVRDVETVVTGWHVTHDNRPTSTGNGGLPTI